MYDFRKLNLAASVGAILVIALIGIALIGRFLGELFQGEYEIRPYGQP